MRYKFLITSNALDHWRQPVESELKADFQSDWQAQLGGNFRYLRRLAGWFFTLSTILFPFYAYAASDGWKDCDEGATTNCEYQIKDGILTVRPYDNTQAGVIPDYNRINCATDCTTDAPWRWDENLAEVKTLNVESGITSIGNDAFEDMPFVTVNLPNGLTSIGNFGFHESIYIANINLPESLKSLGAYALCNTSLSDLEFPQSLEKLSYGSLGYLRAFTNEAFVIPESVTEIDEYAFAGYGTHGTQSLTTLYCTENLMEQCQKAAVQAGVTVSKYVINEDNSFSADGQTYLSVSDMQKGYACGTAETCVAIRQARQTGENIKIGSREYASIKDWIDQKHIAKLIYTIDEANAVAGKTNRVSIRYR